MRKIPACLCVLAAVVVSQSHGEEGRSWERWPTLNLERDPPREEVVKLETVWRLDCTDDSDVLIGRVIGAAPGRNGEVLLVDRQTTHVLVVAESGKVVRVLGRQGEGPGEVSAMYRAVALADERIGTVNGIPAPGILIDRGDMVFLDAKDNPAGSWHLVGEPGGVPTCTVRDLRAALPYILVSASHTVYSPDREMTSIRELALVHPPDGTREVVASDQRRLGSPAGAFVHERDWFEPFAGGRCDINVSGQIAFAPERDRWLVCVRELNGTGVCLAREWQAASRSAAQIAAAMEGDEGPRESVLDVEPATGRMRWRPDGLLWVEPGGVAPATGVLACFDEVSADGRLRRRVQIQTPDGTPGDELILLEDGRFVVLRGFGKSNEDADDLRTEVILLEERDRP